VAATGSSPASGHSSTRTVVVAVSINLGITMAKAVAAAMTGSAALWAETAHSVADTGNEILLFVGLRRFGRPADALSSLRLALLGTEIVSAAEITMTIPPPGLAADGGGATQRPPTAAGA
jgi:Co/Zn/Cd efflux system component